MFSSASCSTEPGRPARRRTAVLALLAAAAVVVVYLVVLQAMPKHVFWSPDEGGRYLELRGLQWDGGIRYTLPYRGSRWDPEHRFFPKAWVYTTLTPEGTLRLPWPIWFPLLSQAPFAAFGTTGLYVIPLLSGVLIAMTCAALTYKLGSRLAPMTILLVGFASPIFFYSLTFWEHTLATSMAMLAVAVTIHGGGRRRSLLVAMSLVFAACLLRLDMFAFFAALPIAVWVGNLRAPRAVPADDGAAANWPSVLPSGRRWRLWAGVVLILAMALGLALVLQSHRMAFLLAPFVRADKMAHLLRMPNGLVELVINTSDNEGPPIHRVWSRLALGAVCLVVAAAFARRARKEAALLFPALAVILGLSTWIALLAHPYRALHGIVPVAPYVVIAAYAVAQGWRERQQPLLLLSSLAVLYLVLGIAAVLVFYLGGGGLGTTLEWGQRYILTIYPLLAILALHAVRAYWLSPRSVVQRLAFVLFFVAMIAVAVHQQYRGLTMLHENRRVLAAWDQVLRAPGPVVTDLWWLPAALADLYVRRDMFVIEERSDLGDWIAFAQRHGVRRFTFASVGQPFDFDSWPPTAQRRRLLEVEGLHVAMIALPRAARSP